MKMIKFKSLLLATAVPLICMADPLILSGYDYEASEVLAAANVDMDDANATTAVLRAMMRSAGNEARSREVTVHFAAGTYRLANNLPIYSNMTLELDEGATIVSESAEPTGLLRAQHFNAAGEQCACTEDVCDHGGHTQITNVTIVGGVWMRNSPSDVETYGMRLLHGDNIVIKDLIIGGCSGHVLNLSGSSNVLVENVTFTDFVQYDGTDASFWGDYEVYDANRYNTVEAIHLDYCSEEGEPNAFPLDATACSNVIIRNCTFDNAFSGVGTHHLPVQNGERGADITVEGCVFSGSSFFCYGFGYDRMNLSGNIVQVGKGLLNTSQTSVTTVGNAVSNSTDNAVYLFNESSGVLTDDVFIGGDSAAIRVDGASLAIVRKCFVEGVDKHGISISGGELVAEENEILSCGGNGVYVDKGATVTISSNKIVNAALTGIRVCDRVNVVEANDNIITAAGLHGFSVENSRLTASGNQIDSPAKYGFLISGGSSYSLADNIVSDAVVDGIRVDSAASGGMVCGNTVNNAGERGIYILNTDASTVSSNTVATTKTSEGIYVLQANTTDISGNKVTDSTGYAIRVQGVSTQPMTATISGNTAGTSNVERSDIRVGDYCRNCVLLCNTTLSAKGVSESKTGTSGTIVRDYQYIVKFNGNGATSGSMKDQKRMFDDGKKLPENGFTRTNYHFLGWATEKDGPVKYKDNQVGDLSSKDGETVTLYAVWEISSYKVSFNGNGATSGTMKAQTINVGASKALKENAFKRTGYTFLGWAKKKGATKADYADKAKVKNLSKDNGATVKLYAVWKANAYTVKFDSNGGTGTMKKLSLTYDDGKKLTANGFTRANYHFLGWATAKGGSVKYTDKQAANLTEKSGATVTLYAVWEISTYKVAFNANGGTGSMKAQSINVGASKALTANAFKRTGYAFLGWAKKKDATKADYAEKAKVKNLSKDNGATVTLYAVWKANAYTVAFYGNGATSGAVKSLAMKYGKAKALPANAFRRTNWTFMGWSTAKGAAAADYKDRAKVKNLSKKAGATVTLYAVWRRDSFTVKFDGNGATSGAVKAQKMDTATKTALTSNAFKRAGYEFLGWSKKKDATKADYANKAKVKDLAKAGKSVTLYAVWSLPAWAHGTFNGSGGYMPDSQYADWSGGVAVAKVSSLGKLSGTLTLEHDGGTKAVAFSAKTFSKYYASRTIDQLCDLLDYDEEDEYGLLDDEEDGVAPSTVSAYVYEGVSFAMPDATTRKANLVLLSWPSGDGKTLMGRICLSLTDDIELELRENLFVSKRVTLPQFSGTPKKAFKVAAAAAAEEWERALEELTKVEVTFGANGQLTIVGLNGSKKVWTTSATLNLWGREGKSFDVGTDFLTPTGRCLWFDCRLTPGKDGKIAASGITFEW